jgi:hypothetical protein
MSSDPLLPGDVILGLGMTAEPNTCGSCVFFGRRDFTEFYIKNESVVRDAMRGGYCKIVLPPQVALRPQGEGAPTNNTNDTDRCDLWKSDGKTYIVSRRIRP